MNETNVSCTQTQTLFHLAAQYLKDATLWYRIADVNNIVDPFDLKPQKMVTIPRLIYDTQKI